MNADAMTEYIQFVADRLLVQLGHPALFHVTTCPFDFMLLQGMETKTNFFESRESSYQKAGARTVNTQYSFETQADF